MESKSDLCHHCGKHGKRGYIKYYYLGLNGKVKTWFRNEPMCKKKCYRTGRKKITGWEELQVGP